MAVKGYMEGLDGYAPYLVVLLLLIAVCSRWMYSPSDPREPPIVKPAIPIVGHIVGIYRHKMEYFELLNAKNPPPVFSIKLGPAKVHIVTSPEIVQIALRNRTLSFDPFSMAFAKRAVGAKSEKFLATSYTPKNDKEECYNNDMHKVYHEPMQPGPDLQQTNASMLRQVSKFMNEIGSQYEQKELYAWLCDSFTVATSIALFGSRNPFVSDPSLIRALWDFEAGVQLLLLDVLPYYTAHKAHLGRDKVQVALRDYYRNGYDLDDDVSTFMKRRTWTHRKYGFDLDEFAGWDLAMMLVATTNSIPTLFWNIVYVLSSPSTMSSIRNEVAAITTRTTDQKTGEIRMIIDASKFSTHCPVLAAAYQETLRLSNRQMSFRVAEEDTSIPVGDKLYLIKKNAVVLLPSSLYSEDPKVWGGNAHHFEPARWLKGESQKETDAKDVEKLQKKAFFPFGGGRHLCPGRHFAYAEILGMVALLVTGYDVVNAPLDGQAGASASGELGMGALRVPRRMSRFFGEAVPKPVGKYDVLIKRKKEFETVQWGFHLGNA